MRINIPREAADSSVLRVWLRRVPVSSETIHAFRLGPDGKTLEEVAHADVYGRGEGSTATERVMLQFRFRPLEGIEPPRAGEELELRVVNPDGGGYVPAELDIIEIG